MTLHFKPPLQHVCLLRLSAIGDTCHAAGGASRLPIGVAANQVHLDHRQTRSQADDCDSPGNRVYHLRQKRNAPGTVAAARRLARAALRPAARHAIVVSRKPGRQPGVAPRSSSASIARVRASCSGGSPMRASRRRASGARVGFVHGIRARLRHRPGRPALGSRRCRRMRSSTPAASSPTSGPHW